VPLLSDTLSPDAPGTESLSEITDLLQAVMKYEMPGAQKAALRQLVQPRFLDEEPLRVYALACRFRAGTEARIAAQHGIRRPFPARPLTELEMIDGATLYRFVQCHHRCTETASHVASVHTWIRKGRYAFLDCKGKSATRTTEIAASLYQGRINIVQVTAHDWWCEFMDNARLELSRAVDPDTFAYPVTMASAALRSNKCSECTQRIAQDLPAFIAAFREKVKSTISQVRLSEKLV
jgi:hypothetical protein